ncbi:MAG: hypothetical protein CR982_06515 [Candidatus Cloacimonadota bacterium]|nr:MAG: hypothetical protein CR982_06515 [Candidatus Cloacimonadota bacterium]PIE79942.1 MAG: hypothetical protein CSA15_02435 [Candidatus Delongbacteria bacterium]
MFLDKNFRFIVVSIFFLLIVLFPVSLKGKNMKKICDYYGVWANEDCEIVQTKKYTLFFIRNKDKIETFLRRNKVDSDNIYSEFVLGYIFDVKERSFKKMDSLEEGEVLFESIFSLDDNKLKMSYDFHEESLNLVEKIDISSPYNMISAQRGKIEECLQTWQLGTIEHKINLNDFWIEIGTNKHSYIFVSNEEQLYCRAARIRSNEKGSVFAQNIRLMFSSYNNETTVFMENDNYKITSSDINIDNSLFKPNQCSFEKDGIYWSLLSFEPDTIKLNGCGSVYSFSRPLIDSKERVEWFKYKKY